MPSIRATGVKLTRSVTSPTAKTESALVFENSSTATAPVFSSSLTPAVSSARCLTFGLRPVAASTWDSPESSTSDLPGPPSVRVRVPEAASLAEPDGFTAADYNRRTGIGRNVAIEVLEFLDALGLTRRTGELRHMLGDPDEVLGATPP